MWPLTIVTGADDTLVIKVLQLITGALHFIRAQHVILGNAHMTLERRELIRQCLPAKPNRRKVFQFNSDNSKGKRYHSSFTCLSYFNGCLVHSPLKVSIYCGCSNVG